MKQYNEYVQFFRQLAEKHVDIQHSNHQKHFFRSSIEEVLSSISNKNVNYPAMVLLPVEVRVDGQEDYEFEKFYGGFMILEALRKINDFDAIETILTRTRVIAEDIIKKIVYMQKQCPPGDSFLAEFNSRDVQKKEWGPVWDNAYGWSYQFPVTAPYDHQYNPEKWI